MTAKPGPAQDAL